MKNRGEALANLKRQAVLRAEMAGFPDIKNQREGIDHGRRPLTVPQGAQQDAQHDGPRE